MKLERDAVEENEVEVELMMHAKEPELTTTQSRGVTHGKYYAVVVGQVPGIYHSWLEASR